MKKIRLLPKDRKKEEKVCGLLLIAPALILLIIFVITPLFMSLYRSFFYFESGPNEAVFAGFENYAKVFQNKEFLKALGNVCIMTLFVVVLQVLLAFIFANVLVRIKNKFGVFVRTIIYLPYLFSGIVVGCIFTLLTYYNGGIINGILGDWFNADPISFTMNEFWAYVAIIVPTIWVGCGYTTLIFYSGLINIPKDYYEAAEVDGAGFFKTTWYIVLPQLKNYFVLIIVTLVTANLQMFEIPMIMTNGQPVNATMTPVLYLIHARANGNVSQSEILASSILIMLFIGGINAIVFTLTNARKGEKVYGKVR